MTYIYNPTWPQIEELSRQIPEFKREWLQLPFTNPKLVRVEYNELNSLSRYCLDIQFEFGGISFYQYHNFKPTFYIRLNTNSTDFQISTYDFAVFRQMVEMAEQLLKEKE